MYAKRAKTILNLELAKRLTGIWSRPHAVTRLEKSKFHIQKAVVKPYFRASFYCTAPEVDTNTFERVCEETLSSLADYFEDLVASEAKLEKGDVMYGVSRTEGWLGVLSPELFRWEC